MDEIRPDHVKGEPGLDGTKNPGGGNRELRVVGVDVAPVIPTNRRRLANPTEILWIIFLNPAPLASPLLPPLLLSALRVCPLGPWDPGDTTGNGSPLLDPREEVVAEERRVGMHPDEALAEVRKKSQAHHDIWGKIQKVESVGVHIEIEEMRGGKQRPQGK